MKKTIETGRSMRNGIVFYSNKSPFLCKTYYNEEGEIVKEVLPSLLDNCEGSEMKPTFHFKTWHIILFNSVLFAFCTFVLKDLHFSIASLLFAISGSKKLFELIELILSIKDYRDLAKFHAAEHMAINAYEKLGRIPNIEELKKASRFTNDCGSNSYVFEHIYFLFLCIAVGIFSRYSLWIYIPICALIISILVIKKIRMFWLKYFQVLFTRKPSDRELELALVALKNFEEMEDSIFVSSNEDSNLCFCFANFRR